MSILGEKRYGATRDSIRANIENLNPVTIFNSVFKPSRNQNTGEVEYKHDKSQDATYQGIASEVNEQYNRHTGKRSNDSMSVGEMRELLETIDVPKGVRVTATKQGEYVFHYRGDENGEKPLKLDPEAAQLAYASGAFDWKAPALAQVAAPDTGASKPAVVEPVVAASKEEVKPVVALAANESDIPAAEGRAAIRYNSPTMPQGLAQNQVGEIQQALLDAGLPVGSRSGKPDEMWGKTSQASFEKLCKEADIDPKAVNFADLNDTETKAFLKAAEGREQARKQRTADFHNEMGPKIAALDKENTADVTADILKGQALPEGKQSFDQAFAAGATVDSARAAILAEMNNGIGQHEARVIEEYAATVKGAGQPVVTIDGKLTKEEKTTFESAIGSSIDLDSLKELSLALKNAGVADGKQAAAGELPQGNLAPNLASRNADMAAVL